MTTEEKIAVEEWKDIDGFDGKYQISNLGRIKRNNDRFHQKEMLLKTHITNGYESVTLRKDGHKYNYYIHRLVAIAFVENPNNSPCVDHIDTIKTNNCYGNLKWCTRKENSNNPLTIKHMTEKAPKSMLGKSGSLHPRSKRVLQYDLNGNFLKAFESITQAAKITGTNLGNLYSCCAGKRNYSNGYVWRFENE